MNNIFLKMAIQHTFDNSVKVWDIDDDVYLVYSLNEIKDKEGLFFKKGYQLYFDGYYGGYQKTITRNIAYIILMGLYQRRLMNKRLKEKNV